MKSRAFALLLLAFLLVLPAIAAAGVLDDGVILHQSAGRFAAVLAPEALGAWHLRELTRELDPDCTELIPAVGGDRLPPAG